MQPCKRCLLLESAQADTFQSLQAHLDKIPPEQKTDSAVYQSRLESCKQCDNLLSGVCMKCGCYVELRAAYALQKCPDVKKRKW